MTEDSPQSYLRAATGALNATGADVAAYHLLADDRHPDAGLGVCGAVNPESPQQWCRQPNHGGGRVHQWS